MPRPPKCRFVGEEMPARVYKPRGVPVSGLERVDLPLDELEALRLADLEGLYHEAAAERMGVSRATFGRLIARARRRVADALLGGKMLAIGSEVSFARRARTFLCEACESYFSVPRGTGRPEACPECGSREFHRIPEGGSRRSRGGSGDGGGDGVHLRRRRRAGRGQGGPGIGRVRARAEARRGAKASGAGNADATAATVVREGEEEER